MAAEETDMATTTAPLRWYHPRTPRLTDAMLREGLPPVEPSPTFVDRLETRLAAIAGAPQTDATE